MIVYSDIICAVTVSQTQKSDANSLNPNQSTAALSHPDQRSGPSEVLLEDGMFRDSSSSFIFFHRENGGFEEVIELPSHSRLSPPEGQEEQQQSEERVPVVAFTENGLLKPLSGVEDISAQQGPGH